MVFASASRSCFKALGSTAAGRGLSSFRPHLQLPSLFARSISQTASTPFPDKGSRSPSPPSEPFLPTFEPNTFSSLTTLESVVSTLQLHASKPPQELALLSEPELKQRGFIISVLTKAANLSNEETRRTYLRDLDLRYSSSNADKELRRKEKARRTIEKGVVVKDDELTMEEWDAKVIARREAFVAEMEQEGQEESKKKSSLARFNRDRRRDRQMTIARREVRREMEEEKQKGDVSKS